MGNSVEKSGEIVHSTLAEEETAEIWTYNWKNCSKKQIFPMQLVLGQNPEEKQKSKFWCITIYEIEITLLKIGATFTMPKPFWNSVAPRVKMESSFI